MLTVAAGAPRLFGQHVLVAEYKGKPVVVRALRKNQPLFEQDGKLERASSSRVGLHKVEEYLPMHISVRDVRVKTRHAQLMDTGTEINRTLQFHAEFESAYKLDEVFLVLDLNSENIGKSMFIWEIGTLEPRKPQPMTLNVPLVDTLGSGKFKLHLFSGGREVFHTQMPFTHIQRSLDRMVAKRTKDVKDALPRPFVGPAPEYPPALRKAKTKGEAVIRFTLSPKGSVLEPVVKSASDPAFGESALAAARQWRFLPKIVSGRAVSTAVDMPFVFTP